MKSIERRERDLTLFSLFSRVPFTRWVKTVTGTWVPSAGGRTSTGSRVDNTMFQIRTSIVAGLLAAVTPAAGKLLLWKQP